MATATAGRAAAGGQRHAALLAACVGAFLNPFMVTVMLVINLFVGRVQITPERHAAFLLSNRIAFLAFAVYCLGGILASLSRGDVRAKAA